MTGQAAAYLEELLKAGVLLGTDVPGVYGKSAAFETVRGHFDALLTRIAAAEVAEVLAFPPVMPRWQVERLGYLGAFPHLLGTVFGFEGDEAAAAEQAALAWRHADWSEYQQMTDLALTPAACYPLYPAVAARGPLPPGGGTFDTGNACIFRREPSMDPGRMQVFHQREFVRIGTEAEVETWRRTWRGRAQELFGRLGLTVSVTSASDPFFGAVGAALRESQVAREMKWEFLAPVSDLTPTALASCNYHAVRFAAAYDILTSSGARAHSGCIGFGGERVTLALMRAHGLDPSAWPTSVRTQLDL